MNLSNIISLSATAVLVGVSNAALHGNPAELPFGLESDMDLEAVIEHFENNSEFKQTTSVVEIDSVSFETTQEINGITFNRLDVFSIDGLVDGIFRVDLTSNTIDERQEAYERLVQIEKYFQAEGLQLETNRFQELDNFGGLVNRVVLVYAEQSTTVHVNSRVRGDGYESGYVAQVSWLPNGSLSKIEEFQSSPTSSLENYYYALGGNPDVDLYFAAELMCTRAGRLELDNWKQVVSKVRDLAFTLFDFDVEEVVIEGTTATATVSTPGAPLTATLKKVNGLWKVNSALGFD